MVLTALKPRSFQNIVHYSKPTVSQLNVLHEPIKYLIGELRMILPTMRAKESVNTAFEANADNVYIICIYLQCCKLLCKKKNCKRKRVQTFYRCCMSQLLLGDPHKCCFIIKTSMFPCVVLLEFGSLTHKFVLTLLLHFQGDKPIRDGELQSPLR